LRMKINKFRVYDVMHRTVATGLIAFTAVGSVWLAYKAVHWFTVKRPLLLDERRRTIEERILREQLAHEKELLSEKEFKETLRT